MTLPAPWQDDAACRAEDSAIFFPEAAGGRHPLQDWHYAQAKAVCAGCPVVAECLAFALSRNERLGVWGGTTPEERKSMTDHHCPRCRSVILKGSGGCSPRCSEPSCVRVAG